MFCPQCGNEATDGAAFCAQCGTPLNSTALEPTVVNARVAGKSDGSLLASLEEFQAGYHKLEKAAVDVDRLKKGYSQIENRGAQWYYSNSDNEQIVASRDINAQIEKAKRAIAQSRQTLADNEERRQNAASERDRMVSKAAGKEHRADIAHKGKAGCSTIVYGLVAVTCVGMIMVGLGMFTGGKGSPLFALVGVVFLVATVVMFIRGNKKRTEKTEDKKATAQAMATNAQSDFEATLAELAAQDAAAQGKINALDASLRKLIPQADELQQKAMEQAGYLYNADLHTQGVALREAVDAFMKCYTYLKQLGTIPSESDWAGIDKIVEYVRSGRADTLKEALQLLSTDSFRAELLENQQEMLYAQQTANDIMAEGFSAMLANQEAVIEQQQRLFDEQRLLQDRQHAQQMAAQASQFALQAEQLNHEVQIRANQEAAYSAQQQAYSEQAAFHDEVRSQPGWVDPNSR